MIRALFVVSILTGVLSLILGWPCWTSVICLIMTIGMLVSGSAIISSQFFLRAHLRGSRNQNKISITFDDGPNPEITPKILEVLGKYKVPATFFCIGKEVAKHPKIFANIIEGGHVVGNHSFTHGNFIDFYPTNKWKVECTTFDTLAKGYLKKEINLFRPPYGVTTPSIAQVSKQLGYEVIGWSLRSLDTSIKNADKLASKLCRRIKNGDIILLHDTQPQTVNALTQFLEYCLQNNIEVVSLEELIGVQPYKIPKAEL